MKNEVTLIGVVESDPKVGETNGKKWGFFRFKTSETYNDKTYDTYHDIMLSGKIVDSAPKKGDSLLLVGKLSYRPDKKTQTPRASINVFNQMFKISQMEAKQQDRPRVEPVNDGYDDQDIPF